MIIKNENINYSEILISVVTITYGHDKYIVDTIEGILKQNYIGPIEFIIANDNSPDNTDKTIREYLENTVIPQNIEIKYTCHKENKGVISNFNWALMQSQGKYIAICEGDDYWIDSNKLKIQVDFLEKNQEYSMCFHNALKDYDVNKTDNFNTSRKSGEIKIEDIINSWIIPTASIVIRKSILPLPNWFLNVYSGDQTLALLAISKGKVFYFDMIMSVYRILLRNNTSMSSQVRKKSEYILNEHIKLYSYYLDDSLCTNKKIIEKKINHLKKELKFQQLKKKHIFLTFIQMPVYTFSKLKQKFFEE